MNFLGDVKNDIRIVLEQESLNFSYPPSSNLGDLTVSCFEAAKSFKVTPLEMARVWLAKLLESEKLKDYFVEIKSVGPYLNFYFKKTFLISGVIVQVKKEKNKYGENISGENKQVMIEYSNCNTHKEYHIGHLRNIAYGEAVTALLSANGYKAIPVSYINDFGVHVAKTIWNWKKNPSYANQNAPKGYLLGQCYMEASQKLIERPEYKLEVSKIMQEIESRQGEHYNLWKETRDWSINYFDSIYKELGVKFERIFYESELIEEGLIIVEKMIEKNILVKSQGAIVANLEEYNLGVLPVVRSDGTALYPVADLALAINKFTLYNLAESIIIVDVRQSLYFKQLFKILELLGYKQNLKHLPYDFITLPDGMMSSRTGNIITYQELKDKIKTRLIKETKLKRSDWGDDKVEEVSEKLSLAVMKFEMLKVGAEKVIVFNLEDSLKFEGYTACYLEYSYARLKSILRKEGVNNLLGRVNLSLLTEDKEKDILMKISLYPEIIFSANQSSNPSEVTKYLFELSQMSNDYYQTINILKADKKIKKARLVLIKTISQVLFNGFSLLGLPILEEM